ncbi:MAG: histidinol dehydrogenase, partial [Bryobacteraceae bacterium]
MIRILESAHVKKLLARKAARFAQAEEAVRPILENVRTRGDKALLEYARRFDSLERSSVLITEEELRSAGKQLSREFRSAVQTAAANIRAYARLQMPAAKNAAIAPGLRVGQIVRPLDTVAAYIPSGRYPLPSTLMMTVI